MEATCYDVSVDSWCGVFVSGPKPGSSPFLADAKQRALLPSGVDRAAQQRDQAQVRELRLVSRTGRVCGQVGAARFPASADPAHTVF